MHDECALVFPRSLEPTFLKQTIIHRCGLCGSTTLFTSPICPTRGNSPRNVSPARVGMSLAGGEAGLQGAGSPSTSAFNRRFLWGTSVFRSCCMICPLRQRFTETAKLGRSHAPRHSYDPSAAPGNASWQPAGDENEGGGHLSRGAGGAAKGLSVESLEDTIVAALHGMENL